MAISGVDIFEPTSESMINWGANYRPLTQDGQLWRLVTCCFLHIGIIHLLFNMYALLYIGLLLEPLLGKLRFAAAYLLTGITASVVSLWWHDDASISAGASGAIFGMYGVFLAMLTTNLIDKSARKAFLTSIVFFVGYNLLNGLKGGIDNSAHIGGLVCGLAIGYAYYNTLNKQVEQRTITKLVATLAFIVFAGTYIVCKETPNDIAEYDSKIQTFATLEKKALDVLNMPPTTSNQQYLDALKNEGIINWNKCIVLLKELDELSIPNGAHDRNEKLIEYCELRIKSYTLMGKAIQEGISKYDDSLKIYQENIEDIIRNLSENISGVREQKSPSPDVKEYYDENPLPDKPQ